ncbi:MAG: DUF2225 domain-containing protein [Spirochaetaceae bacterium]|jgi:uncharacterized protein (DUF2225 family)|nr:DUF2225 domain-containing protein [Spirochaetaceae bacterium]
MNAAESGSSNVSYYAKKQVTCPVCGQLFKREEMLSGGGRMIAGNLTDELRRIYEPSVKHGPVYPLMYTVGACPSCHAAFFWRDFGEITEAEAGEKLNANSQDRQESVMNLFPYYDLTRTRTLLDGAAAHYLALLSYENLSPAHSSTAKQAILALRLAWLTGDIHKLCPGRHYDYVQQVFYRKANYLYNQALEYENSGEESMENVAHFGPDIDKNYGYTGVLYLSGLLEYKYGQRTDLGARLHKLDALKRNIAKVFGLGRTSKNKPLPLLEHARELYNNMRDELAEGNKLDFNFNLDDDDPD